MPVHGGPRGRFFVFLSSKITLSSSIHTCLKVRDYLLWTRVQELHPELRGRSPLCINERFVLDQGNKYRGEVKYRPIINMKKQSNRYCVSRGCYYPRLRDHIRRLIVDGERREQYKLDVKAGRLCDIVMFLLHPYP